MTGIVISSGLLSSVADPEGTCIPPFRPSLFFDMNNHLNRAVNNSKKVVTVFIKAV